MNREQLEGAKKLFFILLGIDLAVTAIVGLNAFSTVGILQKVQSGARDVDQSMISSLEFWEGVSKLIFLTMLGVGLGLVKWLNACYGYAKKTIGVAGFKNEGWTAAGWLIPIFNLFKPYQIINELYKAGAPGYRTADDWKKESGSGLLLTWWIFWAVIHFVGWIMTKQLLRSSLRDDISLQQGIVLTEMQAWSCVISLVIAGLWFVVANHLTQRLLDRPSLLSSGPLGKSVTPRPPDAYSPATTSSAPFAVASLSPSAPAEAESPPSVSTQNFAFDEDAIYATIANEFESGATDKGLWIRLFAECDGDENRTKVAYIKQRAEKLIALEKLRLEDHLAHSRAVAAQLAEASLAVEESKAMLEVQVQEAAQRLGLSRKEASEVVRYRIEKDGKQFRYGDYRYERLADAIDYAKRAEPNLEPISSPVQDSSTTRVSHQAPPAQLTGQTTRSPSEKEVASLAASANVTNEQAREMLLFGVSKAHGKFAYQTYQYDRLVDALSYARTDQARR
jgi:hypothetical protein